MLIKVADVFYARQGTETGTVATKIQDNYVITDQEAGYYLVTDEYTTGHPAEGDATPVPQRYGGCRRRDGCCEERQAHHREEDSGPHSCGCEQGWHRRHVFIRSPARSRTYAGYDKYFFVINDKLSNGLTFDGAQNLVVKVGDATLTTGTDYVVYTGDTRCLTPSVAFKNIKSYDWHCYHRYYTATVNENAVIGGTGNPNED